MDCPICGDPDCELVDRANAEVGELEDHACPDCGAIFQAVVPEPPDNYEGDGVFAENH